MIFSWLYLFIFLQFIIPSAALIPLVSTLAGKTGTSGNTNGEGTNARFNFPRQGDISPDGTIFLVADYHNHLIRQIIISASTVSTLAGQAGVTGITNGAGTDALFYHPISISYSQDGTYALIADASNHLIRKIIISTAMVTTIAGGGSSGTSSESTNGEGTNALFNGPEAITISPDGLTAIVTDFNNHMIRKIIISTSVVSTLAGTTSGSTNGIGTLATFNYPIGVDYYPDGSAIIVADHRNHLIRKIILSTAEVSTLAGTKTTTGSTNGLGTNARFNYPLDIRISPDGSYALVADDGNHMIRSIILSTLFVDTVIGTTTSGSTNGVGTIALLRNPHGVSIAPTGEYFLISDSENHMIRSVNLLVYQTPLPRISLTSPSKPQEPPPTPPSSTCPSGYFRKIDGDSTSCVVLEESSPSDGGIENSSPASDLPTCNMSDEKTDTPTTMVYLIVFCVILLVVIIVLILYFGSKMTNVEEKLQLSRNENAEQITAQTTTLREEMTGLRDQTSQDIGLLKHDFGELKLSFQSEVKSCVDLVVVRDQEISQLKQSLQEQERETLSRDQQISRLQGEIIVKDRELSRLNDMIHGV